MFSTQQVGVFFGRPSAEFEFFGGVPRKIAYDNLRSAVTTIERRRERKLNAEFAKFLKYHLIEARFCNAACGNEKGHVENGVGWTRRNLLTPLPQLTDWNAFNEQLTEGCRKIFDRRVRGEEQEIGERLEQDRQAMLAVPPFPVDSGSPMRNLQLDPCFADLRRQMESGQEHSEGTRAFIRVLQLLREHSLRDLTRAVQRALSLRAEDEEAIKNLLLCPPEQTPSPRRSDGAPLRRCAHNYYSSYGGSYNKCPVSACGTP